jgi:hypothetical protein
VGVEGDEADHRCRNPVRQSGEVRHDPLMHDTRLRR